MTMIGIDPHKATHTAVAIDDDERVLDEFKLRASAVQAERLREWAAGFEKREWAVQSANGLGYLIAQQLVAGGEIVFDVPPMLASRGPNVLVSGGGSGGVRGRRAWCGGLFAVVGDTLRRISSATTAGNSRLFSLWMCR
jgi:hypothetical protein